MYYVRGAPVLVAGVFLVCCLSQANAQDTPGPKPPQRAVGEPFNVQPTQNDLFKDKTVTRKPTLSMDDIDSDLDNATIFDVAQDDIQPLPIPVRDVPAVVKHAIDSNFLVSRVSTIFQGMMRNDTQATPQPPSNPQKTDKIAQLPSAPDDLKPRYHRKPQRSGHRKSVDLSVFAVPFKRAPPGGGGAVKHNMLPHKRRRIQGHAGSK